MHTSVQRQIELYFLRENIATDPFLGANATAAPQLLAAQKRTLTREGSVCVGCARVRLCVCVQTRLVSKMATDMSVPLDVVLELKHVKSLTESASLVLEAIQLSSQVALIP